MPDVDQPMDHAPSDDGVARDPASDIETHVKSRRTWMRLLFMALMSIAWSVSTLITTVVVVVNFLHVLFSGKANVRLTALGRSLAAYLAQIVEYMTFNTEARPFPFDLDWPLDAPPREDAES